MCLQPPSISGFSSDAPWISTQNVDNSASTYMWQLPKDPIAKQSIFEDFKIRCSGVLEHFELPEKVEGP